MLAQTFVATYLAFRTCPPLIWLTRGPIPLDYAPRTGAEGQGQLWRQARPQTFPSSAASGLYLRAQRQPRRHQHLLPVLP